MSRVRDILLNRIEATVRRAVAEQGTDVLDELDLKSDEELVAWYDRFQSLAIQRGRVRPLSDARRWRLDPADD